MKIFFFFFKKEKKKRIKKKKFFLWFGAPKLPLVERCESIVGGSFNRLNPAETAQPGLAPTPA